MFEYAVAKKWHSVQHLPDGLTLIADPTNKRLIKVDRQGVSPSDPPRRPSMFLAIHFI